MSGTAEGMAKRVLRWISPMKDPLYNDYRLMSEFRQSHPLDAHTLENSIKAKFDSTITGVYVGEAVGFLTCGMLRKRLIRTLPVGFSSAQLLVRAIPACVLVVNACMAFGGHVGDYWVKNPHEAEAKFHDWLQNRAFTNNI